MRRLLLLLLLTERCSPLLLPSAVPRAGGPRSSVLRAIASTPPMASTIASTEQGDLAEALEEARRALDDAAMQRELDLQKTSAFWLDKLTAARADAAALASAEVAAPAAAPVSDASVHDEVAQLRLQHEQELEAAARRLETYEQRNGAAATLELLKLGHLLPALRAAGDLHNRRETGVRVFRKA